MSNPNPATSAEALLEKYLANTSVSLKLQTDALRELFDLYTRDRHQLLRTNYLDSPRYRLAYLRYHFPLNVARASCILEDLRRQKVDLEKFEHIVDLGAGPGSASFASHLALGSDPERRFLLTDRSRSALRDAKELFRLHAEEEDSTSPEITTVVKKLPMLPRLPSRALVWLSMVLNELQSSGRKSPNLAPFFRKLEEILEPGSVVIIAEPALRAPGLRLLNLHDQLLSTGRWRVLAPCTHQYDCPLLELSGRPWCHFHFDWQPGDLVKQVAIPTGLKLDRAALSYLVLERTKPVRNKPNSRNSHGRLISDPMRVQGGRTGMYLCYDGYREEIGPRPGMQRGDTVRVVRDDIHHGTAWPGPKRQERPRRRR